MILETKTETLVLEEGESQQTTKMSIDADSHIFLMRMLSKFYSDGIGSLIRETCSNALDSHRACGVDEPIIVSLTRNNKGEHEYSVQDFGCGLDDQDIDNIISKYGKSTKRNSVNQLGAFGLGFKSPLAYTSSFYFVGIKNGIERKWMLYESDNESNEIDLLYEGPTTERNGVKVIVPVKWKDVEDFMRKIRVQLAYFENVYFNVSGIHNDTVKIYRKEDFQWSSLSSDGYMHICLDNVYYPIDFAKLGISPIIFPIGLRFGLSDGLFPVPNREQLKYTPEAKQIILDKITKVATYFVDLYNSNIKDTDNIFDILTHYGNSARMVPHFNGYNSLDVKQLEKFSQTAFIDPKLNGIKYLSMQRLYIMKDSLLYPYTVKYLYINNRFNAQTKETWRNRLNINELQRKSSSHYIYTELTGLKKLYLRDLLGNHEVKFVREEKQLTLGKKTQRYTGRGFDTYMNILELWNHPKREWRARIQEFQKVMQMVKDSFIDADKIEIPQEWHDNRKKQRLQQMATKGTNKRNQKLAGEITVKVASSLERYVHDKNCKFTPLTIPMKDEYKTNKLTIYGDVSKEPLFQKLFTIINRMKVRLVMLSDREMKNIKDIQLHNWIEVSKFMEGKHKVFKRIITAYLINELASTHSQVFERVNIIEHISSDLAEKLKTLKAYKAENYADGDKQVFSAMLEVAEAQNLFDLTVYGVYKEVKATLEKLPFLHPILKTQRYYDVDQGIIMALRDLCKYYKHRIDWQHYTLPINEGPIVETAEELEEINF